MWEVSSHAIDSLKLLFGDDMYIVQKFIDMGTPYVVEVMGFADSPNKYRIFRYDTKESWEKERVFVAEFDKRDELVAMIRLMLASDKYFINRS
jgi:hypothetical protein